MLVSKATLIIMRHGKSDWTSGEDTDFERPLAKRGLKDAPRMGKWLFKQIGTPDCIVSSPARRAEVTARLVLTELNYPEKNVKTTGVETRGNGAATKGTKARGPMA